MSQTPDPELTALIEALPKPGEVWRAKSTRPEPMVIVRTGTNGVTARRETDPNHSWTWSIDGFMSYYERAEGA